MGTSYFIVKLKKIFFSQIKNDTRVVLPEKTFFLSYKTEFHQVYFTELIFFFDGLVSNDKNFVAHK